MADRAPSRPWPCTVRPCSGTSTLQLGAVGRAAPARSAGRRIRRRGIPRAGCRRHRWSGGNSPGDRAGRRRRRAGAGRWPPCSGRRRGCQGRPNRSAGFRGSRTRRRNRRPGRVPWRSIRCCGAAAPYVSVVGRQHAVEVAQEHRVVGRIREQLLVDAPQEGLGVVADRVPQPGAEAREQRAGRPVPAVPKVVGQFVEAGQARGDLRIDFELIDGAGLHRGWLLRGAERRAETELCYADVVDTQAGRARELARGVRL